MVRRALGKLRNGQNVLPDSGSCARCLHTSSLFCAPELSDEARTGVESWWVKRVKKPEKASCLNIGLVDNLGNSHSLYNLVMQIVQQQLRLASSASPTAQN